jgi:leucyl-tRNA synthetase
VAGGQLNGQGVSPVGIKPEQCDREFFDYVFLGKPATNSTVPKGVLDKLRNEFL